MYLHEYSLSPNLIKVPETGTGLCAWWAAFQEKGTDFRELKTNRWQAPLSLDGDTVTIFEAWWLYNILKQIAQNKSVPV